MPCILHWGMQHFVVMTNVKRTGIVIHDPGYGRHFIPWPEVSAFFTGVALQLRQNENFHRVKQHHRIPILKMLGASQWRSELVSLLLMSACIEAAGLIVSFNFKLSIDSATLGNDTQLIWILAGFFLTLVVVQRGISLAKSWALSVFSNRVGLDLRIRFNRMLQGKPAEFFTTRRTTDILSRSRSVDFIEDRLCAGLVASLFDAVTSVLILVLLFVVSADLAYVCLVATFLNLLVLTALQSKAVDRTRWLLVSKSIADSALVENVRCALSLRVFGREAQRRRVWQAAACDSTNAGLALARINVLASEIRAGISLVESVVSIALAATMLSDGQLSLGSLVLYIALKSQFMARLGTALDYLMQFRELKPHLERMADVLLDDTAATAHKARMASATRRLPNSDRAPCIEVVNLGYRFGPEGDFLFRGLNMRIEPGESVAITGPSGCGKSTLLKLMCGLLKPTEGQIILNGADLGTILPEELAGVTSVVMQEDQLFAGSVAENIALFDHPIDFQRVRRCAIKVGLHEIIEAMPMGYMSLCGDSMGGFSGGQKQRLFLARALYRGPRLLFLDEATSHLDSKAEAWVNRAVSDLHATRIIIAHRSETIRSADRIFALQADGIHEI